MQLNTGFTEPKFRPQTAIFPTTDFLSTNSATASKTGQVQAEEKTDALCPDASIGRTEVLNLHRVRPSTVRGYWARA